MSHVSSPDPDTVLRQLNVPLTALTADSRHAGPRIAFAAYPGTAHDGRTYIPQAIAQGAPAILWDEDHFLWDPAWQVPNVPVPDLKRHIGAIAARIYGEPTQKLRMYGITGTNGKSSVAHWIAQALSSTGTPAVVVGTLGHGFPGELSPSLNTTPDAVQLQETLAHYVKEGARACALEVSSHGLHQGRINGCRFDVAVLTNLSRDHLDYHGSMEAYAEAKAGLFSWPELNYVVLNLDDEFGRSLAATKRDVKTIGYGFHQGEVVADALSLGRDGIDLALTTAWGRAEINAKLLGRFNAANLLAALAALLVSDIPLQDACEALSRVTPPAGRMQMLGGGTHPLVVVDYAHTPDALEKVLATLRPLAVEGRVICVFGCGGNRDRGKRPLMGRAASQGADLVYVTSDNPRNEDPSEIIANIVEGGLTGISRIEANRARAIFEAIGEARVNDIVLIAGKGHENYQEIQGQRLPFSDVEVAQKALEAWT